MAQARNAPCNCGSGKKYKKCCYLSGQPPIRPPRPASTAARVVAQVSPVHTTRQFRAKPGSLARYFAHSAHCEECATVDIGIDNRVWHNLSARPPTAESPAPERCALGTALLLQADSPREHAILFVEPFCPDTLNEEAPHAKA